MRELLVAIALVLAICFWSANTLYAPNPILKNIDRVKK
jgi:hypothetical protein